MSEVLLDTHTLAWSLLDDPALSARARTAIIRASVVHVSVASLYEVAFKARRGRWPQMAPHVEDLDDRVAADGAMLVPGTADVILRAACYDWPHRDPFDRIIAATAQVMGLALVSIDPAFDGVPGGLTRVW